MADAKKSNAAVDFLEKFGEKLALGIALLLLAGYFVMAFPLAKEDPNLEAVTKGVSVIKRAESTPHPEMAPPATENWQAKAVNPWNTVVTSARAADDWGAFLVTKAEGKGVAEIIVKKIRVIAPEVTFVGTEVAIDSVTVGWAYKDFTVQEITKMQKSADKIEPAKVAYFVLEREANGSGKWEVLADKLETKVQSYVDTKIEPKSKYSYRVTAYSTDKPYLERGGKLDPETGATPNPDGKVNVAVGTPVQTLGIWKLTFTNPSRPAEAAKGMVYVKIEKFEKGVGKVEKAHIHYDGDQIGFWEESAGAEPVSKHRVATKGGKAIEVDFNINATLITVVPVKLTVDVKRCKPVYNPDGTKKECQTLIEKRGFDTNAITYKDDEGVKKVLVPSPNILDQLCDEHSGKKIVVALPPDKDKPEEPKVDPKDALKAKREVEAEKLFEEAEKAQDKNKSLATTYYTRLLKDFADTDFVSKNKKAIIEERLAGLKKK